jgi:hypothetical protein
MKNHKLIITVEIDGSDETEEETRDYIKRNVCYFGTEEALMPYIRGDGSRTVTVATVDAEGTVVPLLA